MSEVGWAKGEVVRPQCMDADNTDLADDHGYYFVVGWMAGWTIDHRSDGFQRIIADTAMDRGFCG